MLFMPLYSRRRARTLIAKPGGADLAFLARLADEGRLRSVIQEVYPLAEVRAAHDASEAGHVRGKLVLAVEADT